MAMLVKRWYRSRRNVAALCAILIFGVFYYVLIDRLPIEPDLDVTRSVHVEVDRHRDRVVSRGEPSIVELANANINSRYIETKLEEALKMDKGMGCEIPVLDPFAKEVTRFDKKLPDIVCHGQDWVKCYHSKCRLVDAVRNSLTDVICTYKDILYHSDLKYTIGAGTRVQGDAPYELRDSDHVKVSCVGKWRDSGKPAAWSGNTLGFRPTGPAPAPRGYNVLVLGFDSTARNGFIRRMPASWRALRDLGATVLEGYNIVGDGTPAALFPILTGKTELELPDVRKSKRNNLTMDSFPFIFYKMKQRGYRTAYFEDMPSIGTFQYRFNGFGRQPADHYLRAFYLEESKVQYKWHGKRYYYCVGDTPQFKLMMNITEQFLELDGNRFIFTFIADITHDDFNMIQSADAATAALLRRLAPHFEDTLIVLMGDHGPRYANVRDTLQGKLEERLPLMALRLPSRLARARPHAQRALEANARALSTPHDVHATILDVLGMRGHWNPYRVRGADLARGLTLLEPIPRNRSCSEAGIEPHWCACLAWQNVSEADPFYTRTAAALLDYINQLVGEVGGLCTPRTLTSTEWVVRQRANSRLLEFKQARDADGYVGRFGGKTVIANENYQIKVVVAPGRGVYEASLTYLVQEERFLINTRDISRTNAYNNEPDCISGSHPHLNPYCYCR